MHNYMKTILNGVKTWAESNVARLRQWTEEQLAALTKKVTAAQSSADAAQSSADAAQSSADAAQSSADAAQSSADAAQSEARLKADAANPVFTGSFSQNRKADATVGFRSHAEGFDTVASGTASHAEGGSTEASEQCAHAEGYRTVASGNYSHAEGNNTKAREQCAHAEGYGTVASGSYSHAEGNGTEASGSYSHAEGFNTVASGTASHAEGNNTKAREQCAHAEGYGTEAASANQHAQGKYNIEDADGKYAHIVGNGTSDDARSNAHTLDWNGVAWFQGRPQFGGTAQDDGAQTVVANGDDSILLSSSTEGSTKQFKITVDDTGALSAQEVTA